ncbi:MAG: 2-oxo acid dehydrogenase subunit E2 [Spirochaetales bacterium]|nr:2-oxo acid dehydrogenase subunit E2 [Spirochaetales bacterium]
MAEKIVMPRQGNTVESCIILEWKVKEGDQVTEKTVICEAETDKATIDVEAGMSGTILKLLYKTGDDVPVMEPMAIVGQPGEDISSLLGGISSAASEPVAEAPVDKPIEAPAAPSATAATPAPAVVTPVAAAFPGTAATGAVSPRARNLAQSRGFDPSGLAGTGPQGRVIERDVQAALAGTPNLTPAALAALGSGTSTLPSQGTGIGGRITAADLATGTTTAGTGAGTAVSPAPAFGTPAFPGPAREIPMKGIRKIIADRMSQSLASTAQFTLNASAPAQKLQDLRARFKASATELGYQSITINDLVMFALARTLKRYGYMNAHSVDGTLREFENVHIGMAVDTPRGLMVPVIRFADLLTLKQLSSEARRLIEACKNGSVKPEELTGSTISVSNVGASGVESFSPLLNIPEVAILGICAIGYKPMKTGDTIGFEPAMGLSLTIDHRAVDGAPAARFLQELSTVISQIDLVLAG